MRELSDNIMVIYQDTKSNYWFGSWKDGLYKYNGKTIIQFTPKDGFPDNRVEEIKEDKFGNLYFNTSKGIIKYNGYNFSILQKTIGHIERWGYLRMIYGSKILRMHNLFIDTMELFYIN